MILPSALAVIATVCTSSPFSCCCCCCCCGGPHCLLVVVRGCLHGIAMMQLASHIKSSSYKPSMNFVRHLHQIMNHRVPCTVPILDVHIPYWFVMLSHAPSVRWGATDLKANVCNSGVRKLLWHCELAF